MTDEEIKANVSEKAIAYGVPRKHSALFDMLDDEFKEAFYLASSNREFGLPIVRFSHPNGYWVLIGTKELAWFDNHTIQFVDYKDIERYESLDRDEAYEKASTSIPAKFQLEKLGLITKDNQVIELYLEAKEEYFTFQHMMIRIVQLIR